MTYLIPCLSTPTGSYLTLENWHATGIKEVAYSLYDLLLKPGLESLLKCKSLKVYCGWEGSLILNAKLPGFNGQLFVFRSPYDGQLIQISPVQVLELVELLGSDYVLLPGECLDKTTAALLEEATYLEGKSFNVFFTQVSTANISLYLQGLFDGYQLQQLLSLNKHRIETNRPAIDAVAGFLYTEAGLLNVKELCMADDHRVIDKNCDCRTCQQQLTRAYLHHLLEHTPLLCQRFLVTHNFTFLLRMSGQPLCLA